MFYCQSILGIGHFVRSREIVRALEGFEVCFLYGGEIVPGLELPASTEVVRLPALRTDASFAALEAVEAEADLERTKERRREAILAAFDRFAPDIVIIELFPFGRKKFAFELRPLLERARATRPGTKIVCSLRDILVGRRDATQYEEQVRDWLRRYFDLLLVHADPRLQRLEESFASVAEIECPVRYTGYVVREAHTTPPPATGTEPGILVSIGGGRVGAELLECAIAAERLLDVPHRMRVIAGPLFPEDRFLALQARAADALAVTIERQVEDFPALLPGTALSINMAGYNTSLEVVRAGVYALLYPFLESAANTEENEQVVRARKLEALGLARMLDPGRLTPETLADEIRRALARPRTEPPVRLDFDGARETARILKEW